VQNQIKAAEEWYEKFEMNKREKGNRHYTVRSVMGYVLVADSGHYMVRSVMGYVLVADSPKSRIS
jgi:hypothetical protein